MVSLLRSPEFDKAYYGHKEEITVQVSVGTDL